MHDDDAGLSRRAGGHHHQIGSREVGETPTGIGQLDTRAVGAGSFHWEQAVTQGIGTGVGLVGIPWGWEGPARHLSVLGQGANGKQAIEFRIGVVRETCEQGVAQSTLAGDLDRVVGWGDAWVVPDRQRTELIKGSILIEDNPSIAVAVTRP